MSALVAALRAQLEVAAEPAKAPGMQRYMKSSMPYYGVASPEMRGVCGSVFAAHPLPDRHAWEEAVRELWRGAIYREERYAAIALTGHRLYRAHQDPDAVPMYEELIVGGAWWDYVDEVAIRRIGPILRGHPDVMTPLMREWSLDADLWKRRTAVICQVGSKRDTDKALLAGCIDATLWDRDFFIRKGIGWALREHSKVDPVWVGEFVARRAELLSPLSRREALKYV